MVMEMGRTIVLNCEALQEKCSEKEQFFKAAYESIKLREPRPSVNAEAADDI